MLLAKGKYGPRHQSGQMNKSEAEYGSILELRKIAGEIIGYWFEAITFKLAPDCRYTPDFLVMLKDGILEVHEVKGFWDGDAKVNLRIAAALFPFRFIAIRKRPKKEGGGWIEEEF